MTAVLVVGVDDRGHPACEVGCPPTEAQTAALEDRAAAAVGLEAEQRETAAAALAWAASPAAAGATSLRAAAATAWADLSRP